MTAFATTEDCQVCGHTRLVHDLRYVGYNHVWVECCECDPAFYAPRGLPINITAEYIELVKKARHSFVGADD